MAGSTISTDPAVLAAASRCFDTCIPPGAQKPVQTYLWAQIAGITDPAVVLTNARCFMSCVPPGGQLALQAYLAAVLAGGSLDPSTLANAARCFSSCIPPGANGAVITYALANKAGGSTDPSTLVNAARCFSSCIPMGFQLAAQNYLMAVAAGVSTDPQVLLSSAAYACFNCNLLPGMAGSVTASSIATYAVGPTTCRVPTGLAAAWQNDTTTIVTWNVPPAGMSNTEVWSSSDNITFALAATVAAPGVTTTLGASVTAPYVKIRFTITSPATNCTFTAAIQASSPPQNPLTVAWLAQVTANGGPAPSANTGTAINTFFNAIDACGVTSKILGLCMFVPDSLIAATTPLIVGSTFNPWFNANFVGGDLSVNGLHGDGATKYLDTGMSPATAGPQFTLTSCCLFFYAYTANSTASGTEIGTNDGSNDSFFLSNFITAGLGTLSDLLGSGCRLLVASPGNGFYMASRIAANNHKIYFANSGTAWSAIASNALGSSGFSTNGYLVFAANLSGVPSQPANSVLSCVGFAAGLTTTEGQCLYNAIQQCRVAIGGGYR